MQKIWLITLLYLAGSSPVLANSMTRENGEVRSWIEYRPAQLGNKPVPILFVLHGGGGTAKGIRKGLSFDALARQHEFMVIYPDGLEKHWNDGRSGSKVALFKNGKPDDVGFLTELAERLIARGRANPDQIYVMGVSNGGMMTQRLMCEASETFVAGASVIANLPVAFADCAPTTPRPILMINGDHDPLMPFNGGGVGFRHRRGEVLSTMDSFDHWRSLNQCSDQTSISYFKKLNPQDDTFAARFIPDHCPSNHQVELIHILMGGHTVPTRKPKPRGVKARLRARLLGKTNRDFDARKIIWAFLSNKGSEFEN